MGCGAGYGFVIDPPVRGMPGETKFGFTIGQKVEVIDATFFKGWHGEVRAFDEAQVAVDLCHPTTGETNGQWFFPEKLCPIG